MHYMKRVLFLLGLIGLSVLAYNLQSEMNVPFSLQAIGLIGMNILFGSLMLLAYSHSKGVARTLVIVVVESFVLVLLLFLSFIPQIDELTNQLFTKQFGGMLQGSSWIQYIQIILGFWILTFVNILRDKSNRRNNLGNAMRYMRS